MQWNKTRVEPFKPKLRINPTRPTGESCILSRPVLTSRGSREEGVDEGEQLEMEFTEAGRRKHLAMIVDGRRAEAGGASRIEDGKTIGEGA